MAYTTLSTASAGSVLTATAYNNLIANTVMGQPTFTNEAARDSALTAPDEGTMAYLTAPTVPTAAGTDTAIPTGVLTVYNGSAWVCVTPIGAKTAALGTTTSTSFTASLSGSPGTNPSVTLVTGTTALITISGEVWNSNSGSGSIAAVAVSGATTLAAADAEGISNAITTAVAVSRSFILTGLTAGTNTFTFNYRVGGNTGSYRNRSIIVHGVA